MYSYWEKSFWNKKFDFVIIGAGFTGLNVAINIKKRDSKASVLVLDKNIHFSVASTKNAGFACFGSPSELLYDIELMGQDEALNMLELRMKGIALIKTKYSQSDIDFRSCSAKEWFVKGNEALLQNVGDNLSWLNTLCKQKVGKELYLISSNFNSKMSNFLLGEISIEEEGQVNPMKLHERLLEKARALGVTLFSNMQVEELAERCIKCKGGFEIEAARIINCTNAFSSKLESFQNIKPARAQVLITSEIENLPFDGNYHMDEGFYYFRNVGKRFLLGGARNEDVEGETTFNLGENPKIQAKLEATLNNLLPKSDFDYKIENKWSGIMGMKTDKKPKAIYNDSIWHLTGMSGMGVALSFSLSEHFVKNQL